MYIYTMYHVHMTNQNPSRYFTRPCWGHLHPTRKSNRKYLIFGLVQDFYVSFVPDQIEKKPRLICVIENPPQPVTVEFLPQILKMRIVDRACVHSTQVPTMFSLFCFGIGKTNRSIHYTVSPTYYQYCIFYPVGSYKYFKSTWLNRLESSRTYIYLAI